MIDTYVSASHWGLFLEEDEDDAERLEVNNKALREELQMLYSIIDISFLERTR